MKKHADSLENPTMPPYYGLVVAPISFEDKNF